MRYKLSQIAAVVGGKFSGRDLDVESWLAPAMATTRTTSSGRCMPGA